METALEIFTQIAHEKAHREHPGRFGPSAMFADLDADGLADVKDSALIDLREWADTTGLLTEQFNAFRDALACRVADFIEHAQSTLTTQWHIGEADRRHITLPATDPLRTAALDALEGVSRTAADLAILIAAPHAVALLDTLDAIEGALTLSGVTAEDTATAVGAYFDALPPGARPGPGFALLIGHLHRLGILEADERASAHDRNEAHAGIMAARTGVVQWWDRRWADNAADLEAMDTGCTDYAGPVELVMQRRDPAERERRTYGNAYTRYKGMDAANVAAFADIAAARTAAAEVLKTSGGTPDDLAAVASLAFGEGLTTSTGFHVLIREPYGR